MAWGDAWKKHPLRAFYCTFFARINAEPIKLIRRTDITKKRRISFEGCPQQGKLGRFDFSFNQAVLIRRPFMARFTLRDTPALSEYAKIFARKYHV